jgi:hypothetical protein
VIIFDDFYGVDLRGVSTYPVVLTKPNKVVYSVHMYPTNIAGGTINSGTAYYDVQNEGWGFIISDVRKGINEEPNSLIFLPSCYFTYSALNHSRTSHLCTLESVGPPWMGLIQEVWLMSKRGLQVW